MISYKELNKWGRLGNQIFQHAFLRTAARRLGVKFYCPKWTGDEVFELDDGAERAVSPEGITKTYREPPGYFGFNKAALQIEDGTDITGYFQTERYFNREDAKRWYGFKKEIIARVKTKYKDIDFSGSAGIHLRFGDMISDGLHYSASSGYYFRALSLVGHKENILVFSDEIDRAKKYLKGINGNIVYIEGNGDYEDLYLMSQCHDFVCSASTLSWWGAWLNSYADKIIIAPLEGPTRPGCHLENNEYWPDEWMKIRALIPLWDDYNVMKLRTRLGSMLKRITGRF